MRCTIDRTLEIIGRKWSLLILLELHREGGRIRRFSEIRKSLPGITARVLSGRLEELASRGLIKKTSSKSGKNLSTGYTLTPQGKDIMPVLRSMKAWGVRWEVGDPACVNANCRDCGL